MRWIHFASQHLGVITLFGACARLRKATTVMERRSHFLHFLLCGVASQPARPTDLPTIDLDDPSDESMNGWLAGWRGGGGDGSGEGM